VSGSLALATLFEVARAVRALLFPLAFDASMRHRTGEERERAPSARDTK
jgi:hypothetical protein